MKPKLHWKHSKDRVIGKVHNGIVEPTDSKFIKQLMKEKKKMKKTTSDNTNTTAANKTKLSPPWITYYREVESLFKNDPKVKVLFDEGAMELKLFVEGSIKAMALERLMTQRVTFGNVELKITVIPENLQSADDDLELIKIAFDGNDALKYTKTVETLFGPQRYAVFKKDIAQFYNDNTADLHGVTSMLYADIALDVLPPLADVFINTDSDDFADSMVENNTR
jgi:hypothetical protein